MQKYLQNNLTYWQQGYEAENVESFVFRPYGRIFKWEFGLDGSRHEKLFDFGCGAGAALRFFKSKGFDVYGVDMSEIDIETARKRMPDIADHFAIIDPSPKADLVYFPDLGRESFDIVISIQTLFYFSNQDLATCLQCLHSQMRPGGIIYTTMIGTKCWYYNHSIPEDDGLSVVSFETPRLKVKDYHVNFTASKEELAAKFKLFKNVHIGYYDAQYLENEGSEFFWTFIGRKE